MKSTTEDLVLWEQRIKERTKSGMSVSEWCKKNEISKNKYHYWNHKISKIQKSDKEMVFAEVTSIILDKIEPNPNPGKSDDFQVFFKNIQVTVPSNFNEDSLAGLMKVLQRL
ncbi:IS66 family insertion sequence element accessory protein TnpA [Clostridium drakei]|uniref:Transposase n=1 Tax=Clostridium drakei TaxID=332101 RepID=A0A2U8DLF4_9CLOT|nr:hypothetical protein [Clostridium drakei]AWI03557.1 hypothetical protein B9W14_03355 [Clostridium drakei]AWI06711.1 hypothetical protein B9W14_20170 [Clostridium drakei]